MAKRYSGNLQISVAYDDRNHYRTSVSRGGKLLWRGTVNPAPAGFGPGIAYDSPKAYDEIASSALAFADHEKRGIADEAEYDEDLTGYLIRRSPRTKTANVHATKKLPARSISVRKVGARWQPVDKNGRVVRGGVYNADGTGYSTKAGAVEAAAMLRQLGARG
jgi:hypothetical protein